MISACEFDVAPLVLTWHLPNFQRDHIALGAKRTWSCVCELLAVACPYHVVSEHWQWLASSKFCTPGVDSPMHPDDAGKVANKQAVVDSFEAIGATLDCLGAQP